MSFNNPFKKFARKPSEQEQAKRDKVAVGMMAAGAIGAAASGAYIHSENNRLDQMSVGNDSPRVATRTTEGPTMVKSSTEAPGVYVVQSPAQQPEQITVGGPQTSIPAPTAERSSVELGQERTSIELGSERVSITEPLAPEKVTIDLNAPRYSIDTPEK
jgi:hypothetical protein